MKYSEKAFFIHFLSTVHDFLGLSHSLSPCLSLFQYENRKAIFFPSPSTEAITYL